MFDPNPNNPQFYGFFNSSHLVSGNIKLVHRAVHLFNTALSRGRFERFKRWITRTSGQLLDLDNLHGAQMRSQYYAGLRAVSLDKICGSLGRTGDFDCDFNPLDDRLRERWQSIAIASMYNTGLKPVELIQVGDCYFVQDGHHRISVARALGKCAIDAEVTVWVLPQCLPVAISKHTESHIQIVQTLS